MLVTVIVPIYNVEKYIDKCIQSIVGQIYTEMEIILVDDGSSDSCPQKCDNWAKRDSRIRVIHKENGGLSSARNAGLEIASGDIISFIDSDDFIEPDMYHVMVTAMADSGKDIACCGRIVDLWGVREKKEYCIATTKAMSKEEAMKEVLCLNNMDVSACDKIYKKFLFDEIRYPEGKISEDAAVILQIIEKANGVIHVGKPFYHYIFRENSISKEPYTHRKYDIYENCVNILSFVEEFHPALTKYAKIYCSQICGNLLEGMYKFRKLIDQYRDDFKTYKKMFSSGFFVLLKQKSITLKTKLRLFFVWLGIPECFWAIKKICKR